MRENRTRSTILLAAGLALALLSACQGKDEAERRLPVSNGVGPAPYDPGVTYAPLVAATDLGTTVDNPLMPMPVGATWTYRGTTDEGVEEVHIEVLAETHDVWGVAATVVHDTDTLDGVLAEDTWDWFAQDGDGTVWYLGEDTQEYENGEIVSTAGAWTAGQDAALPGVVMLGDPQVGLVYRQEYLEGEAEDVAEVVAIDLTVTVPAGTFTGCIKTYDVSVLDVEMVEYKYYCPGVGNVLTEEDDERVELVEYSGL